MPGAQDKGTEGGGVHGRKQVRSNGGGWARKEKRMRSAKKVAVPHCQE